MLSAFGILCLIVASGVGGYIGWTLWGTGLSTQRAQDELRRSFVREVDTAKPPPKEPLLLPGDAVAELVIPRIDLDMIVVQGTGTADLKKGPGHYAATALPWEDHGRVGIAGHRTTYLHPFWSLDKLRPRDPIILKTKYGTFRYMVTRSIVIEPTQSWVLEHTARPTLVLTTCTPRFSATQRLVVFADRE